MIAMTTGQWWLLDGVLVVAALLLIYILGKLIP